VTNVIRLDIAAIWKNFPDAERYNLAVFAQRTGRTIAGVMEEELLAAEQTETAEKISPHHPSNS